MINIDFLNLYIIIVLIEQQHYYIGGIMKQPEKWKETICDSTKEHKEYVFPLPAAANITWLFI